MTTDLSILSEVSSLLHAQKYADALALVDARIGGDSDALLSAKLAGKSLTPRMRQAFAEIIDRIRVDGFSPTQQELGDALGISKVSAHEIVGRLVQRGVIRRTKHRARAIEVV